MADEQDILGFLGHEAVDPDGEPLGSIDGFYLDADETPQWVVVAAAGDERAVPLSGAVSRGAELQVGVTRSVLFGAPAVDLSATPRWSEVLIGHYGFGARMQGPPSRWP